MAIWQDLVDGHGFPARYASVRRFLVALRGRTPTDARAVITTAPGEEGQVDYGEGPMVRYPKTGKYRRCRLFVLTLGYSRKSVRLLVWQSSAQTWAELHERAFRRLGGTVRVIVLDNLKEGVLRPDVYDPALNPLYRNALAHYGVVALPYTITNTGTRRGAETSQVYLTLPLAAGEPSKRLVGFQKVDLMPGASQQVLVAIDSSQSNHPLSYWVPLNDAPVPGWSQGSWSRAYGDYTVHVGTSSANTALEQSVTLPGLVPGGCMTVQPGPAWVCVNGGWLPPGHPGAGGGPTPPPSPTPPTACTTVQPGPAWVCVNGGWLPPGHPGAGGGATPPPSLTPPTACTTVQPGPAWVCVNGGWLPPGHPGAGGGATPPPSLTPPTACTTVQPGPAWVRVNGGWLPPGHPGAGGGPAPLIPNS